MAVAAGDRRARLGDALLGADHVHDPLPPAVDVEHRDPVLFAVLAQLLDHGVGERILERFHAAVGRHDVIDRRERALGHQYRQVAVAEHAEGLRAGHLVDEVRPDEQLGLPVRERADAVGVEHLLVEIAGFGMGAGPGCGGRGHRGSFTCAVEGGMRHRTRARATGTRWGEQGAGRSGGGARCGRAGGVIGTVFANLQQDAPRCGAAVGGRDARTRGRQARSRAGAAAPIRIPPIAPSRPAEGPADGTRTGASDGANIAGSIQRPTGSVNVTRWRRESDVGPHVAALHARFATMRGERHVRRVLRSGNASPIPSCDLCTDPRGKGFRSCC